ncbi:hypothetical protein TSOC_004497 [Tetrabaena socialis]|uniref:Uncharacterized protein n=1 Tax=Tetrabaena socialis TaxID=47790 RepID=A0A2J8A8T6_9CHLO|nr:hypothetical protein TSOC_004497 [Tetrabaena socialis]|eukprot:PNH08920.1 hypothetical protein TSOC_004497 [Tetrabaena socialis]
MPVAGPAPLPPPGTCSWGGLAATIAVRDAVPTRARARSAAPAPTVFDRTSTPPSTVGRRDPGVLQQLGDALLPLFAGLHLERVVEQDVLGLDVAVDEALLVDDAQPRHERLQDERHGQLLRQAAALRLEVRVDVALQDEPCSTADEMRMSWSWASGQQGPAVTSGGEELMDFRSVISRSMAGGFDHSPKYHATPTAAVRKDDPDWLSDGPCPLGDLGLPLARPHLKPSAGPVGVLGSGEHTVDGV